MSVKTPARTADQAPPGGARRRGTPDLLADWKENTVDAEVRRTALHNIRPLQEQALGDAEATKGSPLERAEAARVAGAVARAHLPPEVARLTPLMAATPAQRRGLLKTTVAAFKPHVAGLFDPFARVAANLPGARDAERVLWEDAETMVVADVAPRGEQRFVHAKALVVPKRPVNLPTELSGFELRRLSRVASAVGDALFAASGTAGEADVWINPPQHLSVAQLHVHVQPRLGRFESDAQAHAYYDAVAAGLATLD